MMRTILATLVACGMLASVGRAESLRTETIALDPAAPERVEFGRLTFRGGLVLTGSAGFGELSSLFFDGGDLVALNDHSHWFRLRLRQHSERGLVGAELAGQGALVGLDGRPLVGKRWMDSESTARWGGGIVVGFEREHRLWLYAPNLDARPQPLAAPPEIADLPTNGGIEAMTELADGRLLLFAEEGDDERFAPAWIGKPGAWQRFRYAREGLFTPTGAALLPDGRVALIERRFTVFGGVAGRIAVLDPATVMPGGTVSGTELARIEPPLVVDNFEGIAVRVEDGRTMLYVVSDDNMSRLQRTLLFAFEMR